MVTDIYEKSIGMFLVWLLVISAATKNQDCIGTRQYHYWLQSGYIIGGLKIITSPVWGFVFAE